MKVTQHTQCLHGLNATWGGCQPHGWSVSMLSSFDRLSCRHTLRGGGRRLPFILDCGMCEDGIRTTRFNNPHPHPSLVEQLIRKMAEVLLDTHHQLDSRQLLEELTFRCCFTAMENNVQQLLTMIVETLTCLLQSYVIRKYTQQARIECNQKLEF